MFDIEGFILAGGVSSRMGTDKAHLRLGAHTMLECVAASLSVITQGHTRIVTGAGDAPTRFDEEHLASQNIYVVQDVYVDNKHGRNESFEEAARPRGALVGIHAALAHANAAWVAVAACDLPFITGALWRRLAALRRDVANSIQNVEFDAVVPFQLDGRPQPLCALYARRACLPHATALLESGERSARALLREVNTRRVAFAELSDLENNSHFFLNINTPADYAKVEGGKAKGEGEARKAEE